MDIKLPIIPLAGIIDKDFAASVMTDLNAEIARLRVELTAAQQRIAEQSERITELYNAQKNMFLSLKGDEDLIKSVLARAEKAGAEIVQLRAVLAQLVRDYEDVPDPSDVEGQSVFEQARAALAPRPEEKGE